MTAYHTAWLIEGKVVLFRLTGKYDSRVMHDGLVALDAELASATAPIYLITDMSRLSDFAKNFAEVIGEMNERNYFNKIIWTVSVTSSPLIRFFGNVASNMFRVKSRSVTTLDEAVDVLLHVDPLLERDGLGKIDLTGYR